MFSRLSWRLFFAFSWKNMYMTHSGVYIFQTIGLDQEIIQLLHLNATATVTLWFSLNE